MAMKYCIYNIADMTGAWKNKRAWSDVSQKVVLEAKVYRILMKDNKDDPFYHKVCI